MAAETWTAYLRLPTPLEVVGKGDGDDEVRAYSLTKYAMTTVG